MRKPNLYNLILPALLTVLLSLGLTSALQAQYTEKDIYAYIEQYKDIAIHKMNEYKIPASITIAQGIFESACGKSHLAVDGNNHFGIKCHQDWMGDTILIDDDELQECFRKYNSAEESYNDHSLFLKNRKRYANLFALDITDYVSWAKTLKADGYATNPKYADQLVSIIERYRIARLDTMYLVQYCGYKDSGAPDKIDVAATYKPARPAETPHTEPTPYKPPREHNANTVKPKPEIAQQTPAPATPNTSSLKVPTANSKDYTVVSSPFTYRKVYENNKTFFVIAKKGDTYESIAEDVQVAASNLRKFNDAFGNEKLAENEMVYIESKAKNNTVKTHVVEAGETLRYIAQRYGVQLEYIFKYNNLTEKSIIHPGDQILLRH